MFTTEMLFYPHADCLPPRYELISVLSAQNYVVEFRTAVPSVFSVVVTLCVLIGMAHAGGIRGTTQKRSDC